MNSIFIHDLRVETRIGVYEWEQRLAQTIRLDIELGLPSDKVFRSGEFADALDYAAVVRRLQAFAADHPHKLMERFAQAIADLLIGEFGAPEDIAYGILYLISDESRFVTGSELVIDGGMNAI